MDNLELDALMVCCTHLKQELCFAEHQKLKRSLNTNRGRIRKLTKSNCDSQYQIQWLESKILELEKTKNRLQDVLRSIRTLID